MWVSRHVLILFPLLLLPVKGHSNDKVSQLLNLTSSSSLANLNGQTFRQLSKNGHRPYSLVIMLTALAKHRECSTCVAAFHQFHLVANSFKSSHSDSTSLFFAMLDFDSGPEVFQSLKLNTAPVFIHFPANNNPKQDDIMDIQRLGFSAEVIAKWVGDRTGIKIHVIHPHNYHKMAIFASLALLVGILLYWRRNNLGIFYNKTAWSLLALLFVFAMLSGQMWNHIRKPPFLQMNQQGGMVYIHGTRQVQYLVETYFVMMIYGAIAAAFILITEAANCNRDVGFVGEKKILALVGLAIFCLFFSLILSIFRSKAGNYPFSFLFK